jgi:hypothetical protein
VEVNQRFVLDATITNGEAATNPAVKRYLVNGDNEQELSNQLILEYTPTDAEAGRILLFRIKSQDEGGVSKDKSVVVRENVMLIS